MKRQRHSIRTIIVRMLLLIALFPGHVFGEAEIYVPDPNAPDGDPIAFEEAPAIPENSLPVLFVHGHGAFDPDDSEFNFRRNWIDAPAGLTSFQQTLSLPQNSGLGIEPYYIRFQDQGRSLHDDASDISDAVGRILERHDPGFTAGSPGGSTPVKVVLIAYSKGTLSSRLYLKGLEQTPEIRPVSEFIAIAPANHGLNANLAASTSTKQMNNGYNATCECFRDPPIFGSCGSDWTDFIQGLNGHPIQDSISTDAILAAGQIPGTLEGEAPGSRADGDPSTEGVLYVTLYADGSRDFVGGHLPSGDCQGRELARNLAPHAVNREVPQIGGDSDVEVHQNTVHTPRVVCMALHTAVSHRAPSADPDFCDTTATGPPTVPQPPRTIAALALDMSGSMQWPACPDCANKIDVLKDAVSLFIDLWSLVGAPGDHLGTSYFRSAVTPGEGPNPVPLLQNATGLKAEVASPDQTASGSTAMGGALRLSLSALEAFPGAAETPRRIILFTDGMQNVAPLVEAVPPGCAETDCEHRIAGEPPIPMTPDIPVDTIGVGAGDAFVSLLEGISSTTGGHSATTLAPDQDLRQFFVEKLVNALRGFSPQLVDYRHGSLGDDEITEVFPVNRGADRVVFKLGWSRGTRLDWRVEKDGVDMTPAGTRIDTDIYRLFALDLPVTLDGRLIEADGDWTLRIRGAKGTGYETAALVDEPDLEYRVSAGEHQHVGEPIRLSADLSIRGQALEAPVQVTAVLSRPGDSLANLLSTTPEPAAPAGAVFEPGVTAGQRKLQLLLNAGVLREEMAPLSTTIDLEHDGKGHYHALTAPTETPGNYKVVFQIQGTDPQLGRFLRTETRTTHVTIGQVDRYASDWRVLSRRPADGGEEFKLLFTPRDGRGNHLGPDYGRAIRISVSNGNITNRKDPGDGSYIYTIIVPANTDPVLNIGVLGHTVFEGQVSDIPGNGIAPVWKWVSMAMLLLILVILFTRRRAL
ncbi:MAG: vWA domain-containing protein [Pseudomonadota bacterium]|nr:vWA domain-containing protein [Pseudomonadota bacterium]